MKRRAKPGPNPLLLEIFAAADAMTASGQEPRKHHVVPHFYLKRWAESDRVLVTDVDARSSYELDPKNALIETDFYRVAPGTVVGNDSPVVWEAMLSKMEGRAAEAFEKLDREGYRSLNSDDLGKLVEFVAVQITRSRSHRYKGRWEASVGLYRKYELDRPGALEALVSESGEVATAERLAQVRDAWQTILDDPWKMVPPPGWEMASVQLSAVQLADLFSSRWCVVYETTGPLLTGDEPVVGLWEDLAADHVMDGGWGGVPIIAFPLGPHQVLAMFRHNMPVLRPIDKALDWRDTLDLNQAIIGNCHRHVLAQPSNKIGTRLRVPERKDPVEMRKVGATDNGELVRSRVIGRWSDEPGAPKRPVAAWWPEFVPPAPHPPQTRAEWAREKQRVDELMRLLK